jgi:hypothetical protein
MNDQTKTKQLHFALALLISFMVFNFGFVVDQTFRWSDHLQGFMNGVFHIMVYGIAWVVYLVPWSLIIFGLYKWRKWNRFRTAWLLIPSIVISIMIIAGLIVSPPNPEKRFQTFTKVHLPGNIMNLRYHFSGGGLADYSDTYYFQTTPDEIDRLISEMNLSEGNRFKDDAFIPIYPPTDWPSFRDWKNSKLYQAHTDKGWSYYLLMNEERNEVYVSIGCI